MNKRMTTTLHLLNKALITIEEALHMIHEEQQMSDYYYMLSQDMFTKEWTLV